VANGFAALPTAIGTDARKRDCYRPKGARQPAGRVNARIDVQVARYSHIRLFFVCHEKASKSVSRKHEVVVLHQDARSLR